MNLQIVSRGSPNDHFFYGLFKECLKIIPNDSDVFYIWANPLDKFESMINPIKISSKNVFIFVPDDLTDRSFLYGSQKKSWAARIFSNLANKHPNSNITVICDVANLDRELDDIPNIKVIACEFMCLLEEEYKKIDPVLDKNFDCQKSSVGLFGSPIRSRIALMSYLYHLGLDSNVEIITGKNISEFLTRSTSFMKSNNWLFDETHEQSIKPALIAGYGKLRAQQKDSLGFGVSQPTVDLCENLDKPLRQIYRNSFVELVAETYYEEPCWMLTEKTLHSIYGCNFLIWASSTGTVSHARDLGFDVFDDVVNHDYDKIKNPIDRLVALVDLNHRLLSDADYAKIIWKQNQHRFNNNVMHMKTKFHNLVRKRVINELNDVIISYNLWDQNRE